MVDCQATCAAPRGRLLEIGWARVRPTSTHANTCLIRAPSGQRIPPAVTRITGITDRMVMVGVEPHVAWRALTGDAATLTPQPAPTVIHFARFERPFLEALAAGGASPLDIVCTHEIARRLLPGLPRRSLRAVAGYFGRAVGPLRRSADHVDATAFIWHELTDLLEGRGISTWSALGEWLAALPTTPKHRQRIWPMPRDVRLSLPDAPGVYRFLRTSRDVLYVGKASSLHRRVNSYFRHQHGLPERMLEMLSQVRAISFEVTPTTLEAALVEPDEIKRHRPPYNIALTEEDRRLWFTPRDLSERSRRPSPRCRVGPFPSAELLDQFAAFADASADALGRGRWAPDPAVFDEGYAQLCGAHGELSRGNPGMHARLLRLGTRLWRAGRRDRDEDAASAGDRPTDAWTPEQVQASLERLALRAVLARRRARWLTRLFDASVVWSEPGATGARLIVIENGDITLRAVVDPEAAPPVPPGHQRTITARHEAFTVARFDRLRVLSTELKRLAAAGAPVAIRFGVAPALAGGRLASLLSCL